MPPIKKKATLVIPASLLLTLVAGYAGRGAISADHATPAEIRTVNERLDRVEKMQQADHDAVIKMGSDIQWICRALGKKD